jgi:hypothetical protein
MSKETKFTAGPWVVSDCNGNNFIDVVQKREYGKKRVCIVKGSRTKNLSNAALIAAAPDLYDALTDMLSGWKYLRETHGDLYGVGWDRAQQKTVIALSKARGEV